MVLSFDFFILILAFYYKQKKTIGIGGIRIRVLIVEGMSLASWLPPQVNVEETAAPLRFSIVRSTLLAVVPLQE